MSRYQLCPHCQQPMPSTERGGVYLPPIKSKIFDLVNLHPGISTEALAWRIYRDRTKTANIRVHVNKLNDYLSGTDIHIRGQDRFRHGNGTFGRGAYRIVRGALNR